MSNLHTEAYRAKLLRDELIAQLGQDDDFNEVLANTIEGETQLTEIIEKAVLEAIATEAQAEGLGTAKSDLDLRKKRLLERANSIRRSILNAWSEVGPRDKNGKLEAIRLPAATLSFSDLKPKPVVTDEALLPADCIKETVVKKPDLDAIKAKLAAGVEVPGVTMSNGGLSLVVRTK